MKQTHGVEFRIRMGLNTGLVVVGAIGKDLRMDYTAVGDTTNLAARLMSIAKPGQIVATKNANGWPDFPGMETNLERTCDGLDVLLKYQAWRQSDPLETVRRWGYVHGNTTHIQGVPTRV